MRSISLRRLCSVATVLVLSAVPTVSQNDCGDSATDLGFYKWSASGQLAVAESCNGFRCNAAKDLFWFITKSNPSCNPDAVSCSIDIHANATIPGLAQMISEQGSRSLALTPRAEWYTCPSASCFRDGACGVGGGGGLIDADHLDTWLITNQSCNSAKALTLSVKLFVCAGPNSCQKTDVIEMPGISLAQALGCRVPLFNTCTEGSGGSSGAAGTSCPLCQPIGGESGCSVPVGGGGPSCEPSWLGKAQLRYVAGGVGADGLPGSAAWRSALGLITPARTTWKGAGGAILSSVSPARSIR